MSIQPSVQTRSTATNVALSVLLAAVGSTVLNTVISLAAQAMGADATVVMGLSPVLYISFTVVGLLVAALAWVLVRARAKNPSGVLRILVPVVVVVSLVPDLAIGLSGLGWIPAIALMLMHVVVAVFGVAAFRRFLPLPR